jgi:hypothetical protein
MLSSRGKLAGSLKIVLTTVMCAAAFMSFGTKLKQVPQSSSQTDVVDSLYGFFSHGSGATSEFSQALEIVTTSDAISPARPRQEITYTYVVTNTGNNSVSDIRVKSRTNGSGQKSVEFGEHIAVDVAPLGDSFDTSVNDGVWTSLGKGDSVTFKSTYVVSQHDVDTLRDHWTASLLHISMPF